VSFTSKTELIDHYENTLGALHVGGHKMIIFPYAALKLIRKYYNFEIMGYVNEPDGVDFYVDPKPLTEKDKREISAFWFAYPCRDYGCPVVVGKVLGSTNQSICWVS